MFSSVSSWWYPIVSALACLVLLGAGLLVSQHSLDKLNELRRMERVPATVAGAVLPGETNITGVVQPVNSETRVRSPETNTVVVYYRYHIERETRDSDGNRSWRTVENRVQRLEFLLADETGAVRVIPDSHVRINARLDFQEQRGNMRYSEYRIHPGDTVFVLGEAKRIASLAGTTEKQESLVVGFGEASFRPIISQWSEAEERASVGGRSVIFSWLGLVLLSCSVVFFFGVFRWHNTVAYLVAVTVMMIVALTGQGYYMMEADLGDARERVNRHLVTAAQELATLTGADVPSVGSRATALGIALNPTRQSMESLSEADRHRVNRIRIDVARRIDMYNSARGRFPAKLMASRWGHSEMQPLDLDKEEAQQVLQLKAAFIPTRLSDIWVNIVMGLGLFAGVVLAWLGIRAVRTKRMMENVPTSPVNGVSYGLAEVKGKVDLGGAEPLAAPLSKKEACWYRYIVKEQRGSGKDKKWVTVTDRNTTQPFWCVEEAGRIQVHPEDATVFTRHRVTKRSGKRRYYEYAIFADEDLYVLGSAGIDRETHERLEMRREKGSSFPYIVSTEPESVIMYRYGRKGRWALNLGLNGMVLAALLVFGSMGNFSPTDYMASALIGSGYLFVLVAILLFNDLVFLRHRADRNRANIDVALQKRTDLVRNLEVTVKKMAAHEASLMKRIIDLRTTAQKDETENDGSALTYYPLSEPLFALRESYPTLDSQEVYVRLMDELVSLEDEIALMRQGYNDAVEHLNYRVISIPDTLIARLCGFKEQRYLQEAALERSRSAVA